MIIGRLLAFVLLSISAVTGLGEAFLLLVGENLNRLRTSDLWVIFVGPPPGLADVPPDSIAGFLVPMLDWPAWVVCGLLGFALYALTTTLVRLRKPQKRGYGYSVRRYG